MDLPEDAIVYKVMRLFYLTPDVLLEAGDVFYYLEDKSIAYVRNNPFEIIDDHNLKSMLANLEQSGWIKKIKNAQEEIKCECGAEKANTTHSFWCPKHEENKS